MNKSILKNIFAYSIMPIGKKRLQVHLDKRMNPQTVLPYSLRILLFFYSGKKPTRLFVAYAYFISRQFLILSPQPHFSMQNSIQIEIKDSILVKTGHYILVQKGLS